MTLIERILWKLSRPSSLIYDLGGVAYITIAIGALVLAWKTAAGH
jgi:hypothetical protein